MTAGIVRIHIESDWDTWRTRMSMDLEPTSNTVLSEIFALANMPLKYGVDIIECTKQEAQSRYDWKEGIDTLLYFQDGTKATLQEKYLDYWKSTATFEERKTNGKEGAWYYCTAQYYFVAYARKYKQGILSFQDWIMIDFPGIQRMSKTSSLNWRINANSRDNIRTTFRYIDFDDIPTSVVIARYEEVEPQLRMQI